jgi:hypothetical protein
MQSAGAGAEDRKMTKTLNATSKGRRRKDFEYHCWRSWAYPYGLRNLPAALVWVSLVQICVLVSLPRRLCVKKIEGRCFLSPCWTSFGIRLSGLGMRSCYARNQLAKTFVQSLGCDFGHGNAREALDSQLRLTP